MLVISSGFNIGTLHITFYGLIMALAMATGVAVACLNVKKRGLNSTDILILACYVLPLAVIGARIYYVIFSLDSITSFWQVFEIWKGGLAIYGGVIGGAIAILIYCAIHKKNFFAVADIAAVSLILGQAIGRIGCYFAGCCYGIEVTNPAYMWFPLATQINGVWHYSTFFYESLWNFMTFAVLMVILYRGKWIKEYGIIMSLYFILYGTGRAWIEGLRGDSLYLGAIKVSQLLSILLIIAGVTIITVIYLLKYKFKKPIKMFEFKDDLKNISSVENSNLSKLQKDKKLNEKTVQITTTQKEKNIQDGKNKADSKKNKKNLQDKANKKSDKQGRGKIKD